MMFPNLSSVEIESDARISKGSRLVKAVLAASRKKLKVCLH